MPAIREFLPSDVEAVAALRPLAFRHTHWPDAGQLAAYIHRIFFENPWCDGTLPSLVYQARGEIAGFLGILPRPFRVGGRLIRAGVPTQYMVHPSHRGIAGTLLIRAALAGAQDLLLADVPNSQSHTMWVSLGGYSVSRYGQFWSRPVRYPGRVGTAIASVLSGARFRTPRSIVSRVIYYESERTTRAAPEFLDPNEISKIVEAVAGEELLQPVYSAASYCWLIAQAQQKWPCSTLRSQTIRDEHGDVIGWFIYTLGSDAHARVLQAVARPGAAGQLIDALLTHARRSGAVRLTGRLEPRIEDAVVRRQCVVQQTAPGLLVHSRDRALLDHVLHGNALITGFEGEWWMMF